MVSGGKKKGGDQPLGEKGESESRKGESIGGKKRRIAPQPTRRGRAPVQTAAQTVLRNLGLRIKTIREEQGLSVAQLAGQTNIAPQTIIHFEDDGRPIRFLLMHQIAECLGYDLDFLLSKKAG